MAKVLVINAGSSSLKYQLIEMPESKVLSKGMVEKIGEKGSPVANHEEALRQVVKELLDGVLADLKEIEYVGHRVVHGGEEFTGSVLVTDEVISSIRKNFDLAPLHNPANLAGIMAAGKLLPDVPQAACFDTAFHQTIPREAYLYALPYEFYEQYRVRRYGFHGTSHRYVARRVAELLGKDKHEVNVITIHLGNGCSITAVREGKSIDTSMGLTPLEGLVMGTRSGDIDPAIIFYLAGEAKMDLTQINATLNKKSGLLGISGISNDVRTLLEDAGKGEKRAKLALDIFSYRVKKYIGAYKAVLGRLDALAFTGGIGENAFVVREKILRNLEYIGVSLDTDKNLSIKGRKEGIISSDGSLTRVFVIPTDEEVRIAYDAYEIGIKFRRR
jgi:acetate kinase